MAQMLEERGLPKVDHLMGGRYVPAVRAFFDRLYGLDRTPTCRWHPMASRTLTDGNNEAKATGLTWRNGKPIWRASRAAIKAGFKPAWVNLSYFDNDGAALVARCHRLTAEANEWLTGRRGRAPIFDGTIGSLINFWQVEPSSPYRDLEPATLRPVQHL